MPIAIAIFRFTINTIYPEITRDAWRIRKSMISQLNPLEEKDNYDYKIDKAAYEKEFGTVPIKAIFFSFIIGIIPKIGPLDVYRFKEPSPEVQTLFKKTMKAILNQYTKQLKNLRHSKPHLVNINLDTGKRTIAKDYKLADKTYEELIEKQMDK